MGDLDQVWIRRIGVCPSRSGHVFASMHAKWASHRGTEGDIEYWKTNFVRIPDERVHFSNSPMAFPCGSEVLTSSIMAIRTLFEKPLHLGKIEYSAIVRIVLGQVHEMGLALDVVDPIVFHPIPHFAPACHAFGKSASASSVASASSLASPKVPLASHVCGVEMPSVSTVLRESVAVSQTWFSWSICQRLQDRIVIRDSLYSRLLARIGLRSIDGASLRRLTLEYLESAFPTPCKATRGSTRTRARSKTPMRAPLEAVVQTQPRAKVLCSTFERIYPGALQWEDYRHALAICRGAGPADHMTRARVVFRVERLMRLRGRAIRERVGTPTALSIWACALALWRTHCQRTGLVLVVARDGEDAVAEVLLHMGIMNAAYCGPVAQKVLTGVFTGRCPAALNRIKSAIL